MLQLTGKENRLKVGEFKLNTLLEITKAINNNLPERQLFELFQDILQKQLNIGKALVFIKLNTQWKHALSYGVSDDELSVDVEKDLSNIEGITVMEMIGHEEAKSFDVVIPIHHADQVLAYVLLGDINEHALKTSPIIKHLPFIQTMANLTVVAVENRRLNAETLRQEVLNRELEMASEMQGMLLPRRLPNDATMQAAAQYLPHQEVGGDFYDVIRVSETETFICIADVSGKGISAAIMMASFQASLRGNARQNRALRDIVHDLNKRVWSNSEGERFITMFLGRYNSETHLLQYVNCAHPPPLLVGRKKSKKLIDGAVGLGMFETMPFVNIGEVNLQSGDILVGYTDGVNELENEAGVPFSDNTMAHIAQNSRTISMKEMNEDIIEAMDEHRGSRKFQDDVALVSCRFL